MYLQHIKQYSKPVISAILKNRSFSQILRDPYFSGSNTKREEKKDQRSPVSLGGISNQQTDPGTGSNYQLWKLNSGPGKGTSRP